jgi:hypothetical protein
VNRLPLGQIVTAPCRGVNPKALRVASPGLTPVIARFEWSPRGSL